MGTFIYMFMQPKVIYKVFWKLKSDWNQTWFIDFMQEPTHVHEVKGYK